MDSEIKSIIDLIEYEKAKSEDFANIPLPRTAPAVTVHRSEVKMFEGLDFKEKDPRKSLHIDEVELPPLGPSDALIAVMASAMNYNTVWTSIFEPAPGFKYLAEFSQFNKLNACHNRDYHVVGSDAAAVILRVGVAVTRWKPGDRVTIYGGVIDTASPETYDDAVPEPHARAWGFETNFGAFTYLTVVRENQLLPKPEHLTWEEAACLPLVSSTAYRMLVSKHGAQMKQGDNVLIWGASGGLGALGIQFVLNGGGFPIGVVSSPGKAEIVRKLGCPAVMVIDHHAGKGQFIDENGKMNIRQMYRLRINIRKLTGGEDCNIVFEHPGRSTFAASVFVAKNGGKIVTCGSTSGYEHVFDNRYLWQRIKTIIGTHGANYNEAMEASRLVCKGKIHPIISKVFPLSEVKEAAYQVHRGLHVGKLGILCLSPEEGLGIRNRELREEIGEERLNVFRSFESKKKTLENRIGNE